MRLCSTRGPSSSQSAAHLLLRLQQRVAGVIGASQLLQLHAQIGRQLRQGAGLDGGLGSAV